jgi:steroid delta-isomerase-like uncharacterized protein
MDAAAARTWAVERAEALFNRGDLDRVEEFVTDDFLNHEAWPGEARGPAGLRWRLERLRRAFPDFHMRVEDVLADGDLVAYRATVTGTHRGELLGIPPTDRSFRVEHMHFLRLRDGKAAEHWACRDDLGMLTQLGVIRGLAPGS